MHERVPAERERVVVVRRDRRRARRRADVREHAVRGRVRCDALERRVRRRLPEYLVGHGAEAVALPECCSCVGVPGGLISSLKCMPYQGANCTKALGESAWDRTLVEAAQFGLDGAQTETHELTIRRQAHPS